ncbi:MAG TPA: alkaline phosphatase family protein [Actinomycetota bacterium]|nr:alkaline phosphatase family protein [Actinomycetota bacterium]
MPSNRRAVVLALAALALAAPAVILRVLCVGRACPDRSAAAEAIPFCSLPSATRDLLATGFRDGRGPNVLAVAGDAPVVGSDASGLPPVGWPTGEPDDSGRVPLAFAGAGVARSAVIPDGATLDAVAPTMAELIGLARPHPGVRSGEAISGVVEGPKPRLVVLVVWKGVGTRDLDARPSAWPNLRRLLRRGSGSLEARAGSLPLDPAAVQATIGTGGLPSDHGITGALLRDDRGDVVTAWGPGTPYSVIAALGDDLDELNEQAPRIGLVATEAWDRGLIGGTWYVETDQDDVVMRRRPAQQVEAVADLLATGYGIDGVPDLLAVSMDGPLGAVDRALGELTRLADRAAGGRAAVMVTGTGAVEPEGGISATEALAELRAELGPVVEAAAVGGFFLDTEALAAEGLTGDRVVSAARRLAGPDGAPLFDDVFPQIAVTFARYC